MSRSSEYTFSQRKCTDVQQVHEKMLNITTHQGNANQNHSEYHLTSLRLIIVIKTRNDNCW